MLGISVERDQVFFSGSFEVKSGSYTWICKYSKRQGRESMLIELAMKP
jgi:hypothetical protein